MITSTALTVALAARVSRAADPTMADCLTASETSIKLRADHQLRATREQLLVCSALTCPAEVRAECERRVVEVNAAIPTLVFEAKNAAGGDLSDVSVTMDGKPLAARLEGNAISIDPGAHSFHFEADREPPIDRSFVLHEGEKDRRERIVFGLLPAAPAASVARAPQESAGHGQRLLGLIVGGAGLAGLGLGGVFGGLTFSSWSSANHECPSHADCTAQATKDRSNAVTFGAISTASFVAGGVLLAGGLTVCLTAPKDHMPTTDLEVLPGGFAVTGSF
jgi:hypothetical protein